MADSKTRRLDLPYLGTELPFDLSTSRREILKIGGAMSLAAFIAACGGSTGSTSGTVTMGSNHSDAAEKKGMDAIAAAFKSSTGNTLKLNTVDHNTFQDSISSYLQGTPDDVFTWFSGHRMRFFADKRLATPIDDVWDKVKSNYTAAFATAVKGNDGH